MLLNFIKYVLSLIILIVVFIIPAHSADNCTHDDLVKKVKKTGTLVTEFSYFYTDDVSENPILIGPCQPCVGIIVCESNTKKCLGIHMHTNNDPKEIVTIINKHFPISNNRKIGACVFTQLNEELFKKANGREKNHRERVNNFVKMLRDISCTVEDANIEFSTLSKLCHGLNQDGFLLRKDICLYNFIKEENNLRHYLYNKGQKVYKDHFEPGYPYSIWNRYDVPLYCANARNIKLINNLPKTDDDPFYTLWQRGDRIQYVWNATLVMLLGSLGSNFLRHGLSASLSLDFFILCIPYIGLRIFSYWKYKKGCASYALLPDTEKN